MAIKAPKLDAKGLAAGEVELNEALFGTTPNTHVMTLALHREWTHGKPHTACAKTRAEVRGGGKKPWKQKGTGRARAGSIRSPLWVGGGVTFGPRPRVVTLKLNKKVRVLVRRSILSATASKLKIVEDFSFINAPKTKLMDAFLKNVLKETSVAKGRTKVLIVADLRENKNQHVLLAARNHPRVMAVRLPEHISVSDYVGADVIIMSQDALAMIERLTPASASKKSA
ncbi:MAG: 50S ribosomal protein L4 [Vampirovibrionales bacterium]|nr:50S ribosomal protein L4 [Vampirovibrionales bacterium]